MSMRKSASHTRGERASNLYHLPRGAFGASRLKSDELRLDTSIALSALCAFFSTLLIYMRVFESLY